MENLISDFYRMRGEIEVWTRERKDGSWGDWHLNEKKCNLIVNTGHQTIHNRLFGFGAYSSTYFDVFAVSNGTATPAVTNTATTWDADGTQFRKAVQSVSYDGTTKTTLVTCYLASGENTVTSIAKFALFDQTGTGGIMFNDVQFSTPKSKNSDIEIYFYYRFITTQV